MNNLNDGMAWGLFPLVLRGGQPEPRSRLACSPRSIRRPGASANLRPGALSDRIGRKWLIASGMWVQAVGIGVIALVDAASAGSRPAVCCSGIGTAMVYPTLLAAIGDVAHPRGARRPSASIACGGISATRLGALLAGSHRRRDGLSPARCGWSPAITLASGIVVAVRLDETSRLSTA